MSDSLKYTEEDKEHLAKIEERRKEADKQFRDFERRRKKFEESSKRIDELKKWAEEELDKIPSEEELRTSILSILSKKELFISLAQELADACEEDIQQQLEIVAFLNPQTKWKQQGYDFYALANMGTEEEAVRESFLSPDSRIDYGAARERFDWTTFKDMQERNEYAIVSVFASCFVGSDYGERFGKAFDAHFPSAEFFVLKAIHAFRESHPEGFTNSEEFIEKLRFHVSSDKDTDKGYVVDGLFSQCTDVITKITVNGKKCEVQRKDIVKEYLDVFAYLEMFFKEELGETVRHENMPCVKEEVSNSQAETSLGEVGLQEQTSVALDAAKCKLDKMSAWLFVCIDVLLGIYLLAHKELLSIEYLYRERTEVELTALAVSGIIGIAVGHALTRIDINKRGARERQNLCVRCFFGIFYALFWLELYHFVLVSQQLNNLSVKLYEGVYKVAESLVIAAYISDGVTAIDGVVWLVLASVSAVGLCIILFRLIFSLPKRMYLCMVIYGIAYMAVQYKTIVLDLVAELTSYILSLRVFHSFIWAFVCVSVVLTAIKYRKKAKAAYEMSAVWSYVGKENNSKKHIISYMVSGLIGMVGFGMGMIFKTHESYVDFLARGISDEFSEKDIEIIVMLVLGGILYTWLLNKIIAVYDKHEIYKRNSFEKNFFGLISMLFMISGIMYGCIYPLCKYIIVPGCKAIPLLYNWIVHNESPFIQAGVSIVEFIVCILCMMAAVAVFVSAFIFMINMILLPVLINFASFALNVLAIPIVLGLMTVKVSLHAATLIIGYSLFGSMGLPESIVMMLSFLFSVVAQYCILENMKKSELLREYIAD